MLAGRASGDRTFGKDSCWIYFSQEGNGRYRIYFSQPAKRKSSRIPGRLDISRNAEIGFIFRSLRKVNPARLLAGWARRRNAEIGFIFRSPRKINPARLLAGVKRVGESVKPRAEGGYQKPELPAIENLARIPAGFIFRKREMAEIGFIFRKPRKINPAGFLVSPIFLEMPR